MTAFMYLIGNGRSGSMLVHELLARHGGVGFVSNLEDRFPCLPPATGRYDNALCRRVPPALTRKGRPQYAPSEAYRSLSRQFSPMIANSSRNLLASDAMPWVARRPVVLLRPDACAKQAAVPPQVHRLAAYGIREGDLPRRPLRPSHS